MLSNSNLSQSPDVQMSLGSRRVVLDLGNVSMLDSDLEKAIRVSMNEAQITSTRYSHVNNSRA